MNKKAMLLAAMSMMMIDGANGMSSVGQPALRNSATQRRSIQVNFEMAFTANGINVVDLIGTNNYGRALTELMKGTPAIDGNPYSASVPTGNNIPWTDLGVMTGSKPYRNLTRFTDSMNASQICDLVLQAQRRDDIRTYKDRELGNRHLFRVLECLLSRISSATVGDQDAYTKAIEHLVGIAKQTLHKMSTFQEYHPEKLGVVVRGSDGRGHFKRLNAFGSFCEFCDELMTAFDRGRLNWFDFRFEGEKIAQAVDIFQVEALVRERVALVRERVLRASQIINGLPASGALLGSHDVFGAIAFPADEFSKGSQLLTRLAGLTSTAYDNAKKARSKLK